MSVELELKMVVELGVGDDICRKDPLVAGRVTNRDQRVATGPTRPFVPVRNTNRDQRGSSAYIISTRAPSPFFSSTSAPFSPPFPLSHSS